MVKKRSIGKQKRRRNVGFVIAGLIILLVLGIFAQQFSIQGFSTLSLDRVDFSSNDNTIGGQAFLVSVVQNGVGQSVSGSFSTSQLNSELDGEGVETSKDLSVSLSTEGQECVYDIRTTNDALRRLNIIEQDDCLTNICLNSAIDRCRGEQGTFAHEGGFISRKKYICYDFEYVGTVGTVGLDRLAFETTVEVEVDGEDFSGVISNSGDRSVVLGDNRVHASWQGNLASGLSCPSPSGQDLVALYTDRWSLISESAYDDWKNIGSTVAVDDCMDRANNNAGVSYASCVDNYNGLLNVATNPVDFVSSGGSDVELSGSASSGEIRLPLGNLIEYPMITMRIAADVLGIVIPVGMPEIVDVIVTDASLGVQGNIRVDVKNVGTERASFNVAVECQEPFSVRGASPVIQVELDRTSTANIPFSAGVEGTKGCVVTVSDLENPNNRDIDTFSVSASGFTSPCTSGDLQCIGVVEQVCRGGVWEVTGTTACETVGPVGPVGDLDRLIFVLIVIGITGVIVAIMVAFKKRGVF